jgi:hypothetical protein
MPLERCASLLCRTGAARLKSPRGNDRIKAYLPVPSESMLKGQQP